MIPPFRSLAAAALLAASPAAAETLVAPDVLTVDPGLPPTQREAVVLAARRYATFWNTGDPAYARAALAETFVDETLPPGRVQGPAGPLLASEGFRKAVPDLTCEIVQMIVAGDRAVLHLRFRGHFTGTFEGKQGRGQPVAFIATDIYRVADGRIAANWHIEDNLTLLRQLGAVPAP
ncbi:MAG: ester cyclase [Methylorubrum populi]